MNVKTIMRCCIFTWFPYSPNSSWLYGALSVLVMPRGIRTRIRRGVCRSTFVRRLRTWWGSRRSRLCEMVARNALCYKTQWFYNIIFQKRVWRPWCLMVPPGCLLVPPSAVWGRLGSAPHGNKYFSQTVITKRACNDYIFCGKMDPQCTPKVRRMW